MTGPSSKPYRQHILERLKTPEDAGGYLAASLAENADCPEATGLVIQDIIAAFSLPLEVNTRVSVDSVALGVDEAKAKKLARRIIDAVINSPCVVEVRMFSQPEAVENLEDEIVRLIRAAASPAPKEEEARKVAIEILEWLNFDTSLDAVATDIYGVEAIIARHFCAPAPAVSDCDPDD